jgi:hypothetical protein
VKLKLTKEELEFLNMNCQHSILLIETMPHTAQGSTEEAKANLRGHLRFFKSIGEKVQRELARGRTN